MTASNWKSFMMDLAVIIAGFQREVAFSTEKQLIWSKWACHGAGHNPPLYNKR